MKLFKLKKLSAKITFMVGVIILIVAGGVAAYMQTRIITEIGRFTESNLKYQMKETAEKCNHAFFDAAFNDTEISTDYIQNLVKDFKIYESGFALLKRQDGNFYETNDFVKQLSESEKEKLTVTAVDNLDTAFEIKLSGSQFLGSSTRLFNGYVLLVFAPEKEVNAEITASLIRFAIIFVIAYSLVLIVASVIGKNMGKPIGALSAFMRRAGTTGNVNCTPEEEQALNEYMKKDDEIGQLVKDCGGFIDHVITIADKLENVADGDLTVQVKTLSESDIMAVSLNRMIKNLNDMFGNIRTSAVEVSSGSGQIAEGASSLSSGATMQSATIQELSSSIERILSQTCKNAAIAKEAAAMSNEIRDNAEKGSAQMNNMIQAVTEINQASEQISKVIKVIDDIAFQTNILALNAAVEAARAGQHGKGFAVVAEEVRNLASKSAEAAKNTGGLIENSVSKANLGMSIATETSESLKEIVGGINKSAGIINKIADDSYEQSSSINMLNNGIEQVSRIIQQNSAAAEESAASSQEMNAQAAMLEGLVSQFKLK
ncbi:MAG: methyl-accepting chemotaxis protein [Oscillospiraceae bacterium]|nr:methyl-accepting chemotaxis protein [Oscillospiraceae bacterium]